MSVAVIVKPQTIKLAVNTTTNAVIVKSNTVNLSIAGFSSVFQTAPVQSDFVEINYTGGIVDRVTTWTDSGMTKKIEEVTIFYSGGLVDYFVTKFYDGAGVLAKTLTSTLAYSSGVPVSITEVLT